MKRDTYCVMCRRDLISLAFCGELALRIASTFLRVGLDTTGTKSMAIEPDFTLRELAFVLVEAKVVVFESLENTTTGSCHAHLSPFQTL